MLKRILALAMASILLWGCTGIPVPARATEPTETVDSTVSLPETTETTTEPTVETTAEAGEETTGETTAETAGETTAETTEETTEETEPETWDSADIDEIYDTVTAALQAQTPGTGSTGGEWLVLGLARAGELTDRQKAAYLETAKSYVEKKYDDAGKLHKYKPTENERLALALTAVGQDPADFYGYDLLKALEDTSWATSQGNNASAFALLACNAAGYAASNEENLIRSILNNRNTDGGWAITTGSTDSDTTAMVVQALAPYYSRPEVKAAVDGALSLFSGCVNSRGQICPDGHKPSAENTAQVIVALTELGIDPAGDPRFIREGKNLLDGLAAFYTEGQAGFAHEENGSHNQMATEQAYYALVAWYRLQGGETSLYDMRDVAKDTDAAARVEALIAAIGEVTADSGAAIEAARRAYEALSDHQKALVANYDVLTGAEIAYAPLAKTAEDEAAADTVEALIDAIGTPVTPDREGAIAEARKAYDALTATQKALVDNYGILTAAEAALKEIREEEAAQAVESLIDDIGTVTLSRETAIRKARSAYNALTAAQRERVDNYQTLLDAETALQDLKATVSVKFTLLGCWEHGEAGEVHTLTDGNLSTWIGQKTYKVSSGATVREVLEKALTGAGLDWENPTGNYVESIDGIGEFTNGSLSGWMYTLNGTHPNLGINQQTVKNGDVIVFHYTDDYTREEGSRQFQNNSANVTTSQNTRTQTGAAAADSVLQNAYRATGEYLESLGTPGVGSVGGEWMVMGLARSGRQVPEGYFTYAASYIAENIDENGRLHRAKSTENSRMILALTAIGKNAADVAGYNLLQGLTDLEYLQKQGINGPIWALTAFDCGNYPIPEGNVTRQALVETILAAQLPDGGWALSGSVSDPDMTGMALQALAAYREGNAQVAAAAEKAVRLLSETQNEDGSWSGIDGPSSESVAQVIVALTALGIDPDTDERFVKNGSSAVDALLDYYVEGGGFRHTQDSALDGMATEQGYYALTAYNRFLESRTRLYDMTDVLDCGGDAAEPAEPEKDEALEPSQEEPDSRDLKVLLLGICAGIGIGFILGVLLCGGIFAAWIILKKQLKKEV